MDEVQLTLLTTVVTNLPAIPLIYRCYKENDFAYAVCGFMSILTSLMYHICDTLKIHDKNTLFFMNAGQWHRLDNVFIIIVLNVILADLVLQLSHRHGDFYRWIVVALTLWFQEKGPWQIENTILPIVIPFGCCIVVRLTTTKFRPTYVMKNLYIGLACVVVGVFFFVRGLDDDNDWIRINHGLWHAFVAVALYFLRYAVKRDGFDEFVGLVTEKFEKLK
jgi:predicted membrane channel-forming protein YqfA (hemolysin III family)